MAVGRPAAFFGLEEKGCMKCRICASECPPGAKLCRDCAAARKRAFAATVTQPLLAAAGAPSVGRPRFAPRPERRRSQSRKPRAAAAARSEAAMAASAAEGAAPARARRPIGVQWLLLALAVACAIVYLLIRMLFAHHGEADDGVAPSDAASGIAAPAAAARDGAAALAVTPLPPPAPTLAAATPQPTTPAADTQADAANALKNAAAKAGRRKAAKAEVPVIAVTEPAPPPPEPVPAARAAPPPVVETPRDPWQPMNEGMSRCAQEDVVHREACEQQLRLQYCPGHWGVVWQCPIGPLEHGR
jgi:ferredoxin